MTALILLSVLAIALLFLGLYKKHSLILPTAVIGLLAAAGSLLPMWNQNGYFYNQMVFFDNYAIAFGVLLIVSTAIIFLFSKEYFEKISSQSAEYYALLIFTLVGALLMVTYHNFVMLFIGIETLSISLYVLAGIKRNDMNSNEAALKYFLMGAFATGFLLFGIALIYGVAGSFNLSEIATVIQSGNGTMTPILAAGIVFLMIGLMFKVSAAPFHFWAPDVYTGSPSMITLFMSTVVKTAGFAAFLRILMMVFMPVASFWTPILIGSAILSLLFGNITAVFQTNFKRLLAYSSVSHAGYMLLILAAPTVLATNALYTYAAAYILATIIAFVILIKVKDITGSEELYAFNGLGKTQPMLALLLSLSMCSLAGIPLTAGFMGKFLVFSNAIGYSYTWLIVFAVANSAIGIYYYFKVIIAMYTKPAAESQSSFEGISTLHKILLATVAICTIVIGIMPGLLSW